MKKTVCAVLGMALIGGAVFTGCSKTGGDVVMNKDKPLVFFNNSLLILQLAKLIWLQ